VTETPGYSWIGGIRLSQFEPNARRGDRPVCSHYLIRDRSPLNPMGKQIHTRDLNSRPEFYLQNLKYTIAN
jgi:hypothetical protein